MVNIRGALKEDAEKLFPLIFKSKVTDTIQWDGPENFEAYQKAIEEKSELHQAGKEHFFTIVEIQTEQPIGSISIRPDNTEVANIGFWIGEKFHGKGYGTKAVSQILDYGFNSLKLEIIEAFVFDGNFASRKVLEKNGLKFEKIIPKAITKRGRQLDEWKLSITRAQYNSIV
jgi:RimJ/RimL family protein N-acetyltransferase